MKLFILIGVLIMSSCSETLVKPVPKKKPYEIITHGHKRVDDYYWMRLTDEQKKSKIPDKQTKEVLNYIGQENILHRLLYHLNLSACKFWHL